jgi:hypothetical protein
MGQFLSCYEGKRISKLHTNTTSSWFFFKKGTFFGILLLKIKHKRKIWSITLHRHVRCFIAFDTRFYRKYVDGASSCSCWSIFMLMIEQVQYYDSRCRFEKLTFLIFPPSTGKVRIRNTGNFSHSRWILTECHLIFAWIFRDITHWLPNRMVSLLLSISKIVMKRLKLMTVWAYRYHTRLYALTSVLTLN